MTDHQTETFLVDSDKLARAAKVGPRSSLISVRLIDLEARTRETNKEAPSLMRLRHSAKSSQDIDAGLVHVVARLGTDLAHNNDESKKNPPIVVTAAYALVYRIEGISDFDQQDLDSFAEVNGIYNIWPFWRELFHSILWRMGIEPSVIPSLRVKSSDSSSSSDE